jgi:hypothetical protein
MKDFLRKGVFRRPHGGERVAFTDHQDSPNVVTPAVPIEASPSGIVVTFRGGSQAVASSSRRTLGTL